MIRMLIADDHTIMREGLKQLFMLVADVQVVAEAESGTQLIELLRQVEIDLLLLDMNMPGSRTCIVILEAAKEGESQVLGVVVDSVSEVIEILDIDIKPAPAFGNPIRTDFIRGMTKVRGDFVTLLQVEHVLCVDEMAGLM
ncbi:response regulator [Pseudomonas fildesensis]|uniref:response regulator n=1 Tax=Pseudomonas fildesensis TaxID=1674920 RepID=UPI0009E26D17|nr:response regulator [Pseudomonas fildesensis]